MINDDESIAFLGKLATSSTGKRLVEYLKKVEAHYSDMRTLKDLPEAEKIKKLNNRLEALDILRESLLDRLLVLGGEVDPPNNDEFH